MDCTAIAIGNVEARLCLRIELEHSIGAGHHPRGRWQRWRLRMLLRVGKPLIHHINGLCFLAQIICTETDVLDFEENRPPI